MRRIGVVSAVVAVLSGVLVLAAPAAGATTVTGGGDAIQQAIDDAVDGEVIRVEAGVYGPIDFAGKDVEVHSVAGPEATVIDAGGSGTAVTFDDGETRAAVLHGFTVTGGWNTSSGAGIHVRSSSPSIVGNVVEGNVGCSGVGIRSSFGSPRIEGNVIRDNSSAPTGYSGCRGGGVYIGGASAAELVGNEISGNQVDAGGGGVELNASADPLVTRNVISGNRADRGGGLESANANHGRFEQNVFRGNHARFEGGAILWSSNSSGQPFRFVNNTVVGNTSDGEGDGAIFTFFWEGSTVVNNVFAVTSGDAFGCGSPYVDQPSMDFASNTLYAGPGADPLGDGCEVSVVTDGNQVMDPMVDTTGVPRPESPVVDTGRTVTLVDPVDVAGRDRIVDGDGVGGPVIDRGAFEVPEAAVSAPAAPQDLTATFQKRNRAGVTWAPPAEDGGAPISGYELLVVETGEHQRLSPSARAATISGVRSPGPYEIRVWAVNSAGAGQPAIVVLEDSGGDGDGGGPKCHPKRGC